METYIQFAAISVFEEWQKTRKSFLKILNHLHRGKYSAKERSAILREVRELRDAQKEQIREWVLDFQRHLAVFYDDTTIGDTDGYF